MRNQSIQSTSKISRRTNQEKNEYSNKVVYPSDYFLFSASLERLTNLPDNSLRREKLEVLLGVCFIAKGLCLSSKGFLIVMREK